MTEHTESFEELKSVIKLAIPGFRDLNVKARGGPGEVIAFWQEKNIDTDLSLADLSEGNNCIDKKRYLRIMLND